MTDFINCVKKHYRKVIAPVAFYHATSQHIGTAFESVFHFTTLYLKHALESRSSVSQYTGALWKVELDWENKVKTHAQGKGERAHNFYFGVDAEFFGDRSVENRKKLKVNIKFSKVQI